MDRTNGSFGFLTAGVIIHCFFHMFLALFSSPNDVIAEGIHQPIGPCYNMEKIQTITGIVR